MRPILFSFSIIVLLSAPALANDPAQPKEERKICRTQQAPTGSHRPGKRICHTETEWKAIDSGVDNYAQPDQRTPVSSGGSGQ